MMKNNGSWRMILARFIPVVVWIGIALGMAANLPAAQNEAKSERRWKIYLSAAGGKFAQAAFPQNFVYYQDGHLWQSVEASEDDPELMAGWTQANSNNMLIPTLGFMYRFLGPSENENATGWERFIQASFMAEATYVPAHRFPDGIEKESQTKSVIQIFQHPQTDRKAGAWGISLGLNLVPYSKIPIGLDIKFGLWFSQLEYFSGTCLFYDGAADMSFLTDTKGGRAMGAYKGQGRWESNHTAFAFGYGLKFRPWRWASLDLGWTDLMYFRSEPSNFIYVGSGDTAYDIKVYGLGSIWSLGLTVYF